jgi:thioester reductase-like protein
MNLLSFCRRGAKKRFVFMSSVAAAMGSKPGTTIAEAPLGSDPAIALPTGYAQSKSIIEQVTQHYASRHRMPVHILRVGQLCGHSKLGWWNETEMWPIMIETGLRTLSAMPVLQANVDWLPVDICAQAIQKAVFRSSDHEASYAVTNLVNSKAISWDRLLSLLSEASGIAFERVDMKEWVTRLETKIGSDMHEVKDIPASRLLSFFQDMVGESSNGEGVVFETSKSMHGKSIDVHLVRNWLEKWHDGAKKRCISGVPTSLSHTCAEA